MKTTTTQIRFTDKSKEGWMDADRVDDGTAPQVEITSECFTFEVPKEVDEFAKAVKELLKP